MPTILKISYASYVIKNDAAAFAAMKALVGAVKVNSRHVHVGKDYREVFWPDGHESEISIKTVSNNQLVASDPGENEPFEEPKRIPFKAS